MNFDELIFNINGHKDLRILATEYSEAAFGNFVVNILFCDEMRLRMINDRGIVELDIVLPGWLRERHLPVKFAVSSALSHGNNNGPYEFESVAAAYKFLTGNLGTLEEICKQRLLGKTWRAWWKNTRRNMVR